MTAAGLAAAIGMSLAAERRDAPALAHLSPLVGHAVALAGRLRAGLPAWGAAASLAVQAAVVLAVVALFGRSRRARDPDQESLSWTAGEALAYGSLMAVALAIRFYAVNLVPWDWLGETAAHVAAATDLTTMARRALGEPPLISQGLVWYALEHLWVGLFGTSFATGRVLQASVSFVAVPVLYAFLRRVAGREAALLGAALLAFGPVEVGWSRSEYLIPYADVYAITLALTTYAAGESPRRITLLALSLEMGLGALVYPAARLLPLLPLVYLPLRRRCEPSPAPAPRVGRALAAGGMLFLLAPVGLRWIVFGTPGPFNPLEVEPGLGLWAQSAGLGTSSRVLEWLRDVAANGAWLVRSLFLRSSDSLTTTVSSFPPATLLSPFVATFFVASAFVAMRRRRPRDLLILLWIALAILPMLPADGQDARRVTAAFPAFAALAAATAWEVCGALARGARERSARLACAGLLCAVVSSEALTRAGLFFRKPEGRPDASLVARAIRPALTPGTLLVVDLKYEYWDFFEGKLFLELFDVVQRERDVALFALPEEPSPGDAIPWPDPEKIPYRGTVLSRLPAAEQDRVAFAARDLPVFLGRRGSMGRWHRVVFLVRNTPESAARLATIRTRYPASRTVIWPIGPAGCGGLVVVDAPLSTE